MEISRFFFLGRGGALIYSRLVAEEANYLATSTGTDKVPGKFTLSSQRTREGQPSNTEGPGQ